MNLDSRTDMMDNFSSQAETYARYRPSYPDEMYEFIFQHVRERKTAWDCATGSGQVAQKLSLYFAKVYATDISKEQMKHAPQKSNIEYLQAPAENSALPDNAFDLITVAQAIHWFDFEGFYREVKRTAKPGALLSVIGYGMIRMDEHINPLLDRFYDEMFGTYFSENRGYINESYQGIPFPFEEIPAPAFQISYRWSIEELEGYLNSWSAVQKFKEKDGYNPVDDFVPKLQSKVGWEADEKREVVFPIFMRLGKVFN